MTEDKLDAMEIKYRALILKAKIEDNKFNFIMGTILSIMTVVFAIYMYLIGLWGISIFCIFPVLSFSNVSYISWKRLKHGDEKDESMVSRNE